MRPAGDGGHVLWAFRGWLGLAWTMEEGGIGCCAMSSTTMYVGGVGGVGGRW
jgi:hypothetical protein